MSPNFTTGILERARDAAFNGLIRRAEESEDISTLAQVIDNLPDGLIWWLALAALNCLVFVPPIIFLSYSVNSLWPVLCIVEDDAPPTYERIALQDRDADKEDEGEKPEASLLADEAGGLGSEPPVTTDLRRLNRMLYDITGWPSLLRGLRPHMFFNLSVTVLTVVMTSIPFLPRVLGIAVAPLAVVQLYTAWVHIAIAAPSPQPFYRRFPPFATAFRATALPTAVMWFAVGVAQELPLQLFGFLDIETWDPTGSPGVGLAVPCFDLLSRPGDFLKILALLAAWLLPVLLLVIPAHAVLTRVQASLLPAGERTVVPFDRSFRGLREDGQEYVGMLQAFRSFSHASWLRLAVLYVKIISITLAAGIFMGAAVGIQIIIVWSNFKKNGE